MSDYMYKTQGSRPTSDWMTILAACAGEILELPVMSSITLWRATKGSNDYLPYYMIYTNCEGQVRRQALQED